MKKHFVLMLVLVMLGFKASAQSDSLFRFKVDIGTNQLPSYYGLYWGNDYYNMVPWGYHLDVTQKLIGIRFKEGIDYNRYYVYRSRNESRIANTLMLEEGIVLPIIKERYLIIAEAHLSICERLDNRFGYMPGNEARTFTYGFYFAPGLTAGVRIGKKLEFTASYQLAAGFYNSKRTDGSRGWSDLNFESIRWPGFSIRYNFGLNNRWNLCQEKKPSAN